ncbi:MAG: FHA domain-containing protein [Myxococcaceae bacterium]
MELLRSYVVRFLGKPAELERSLTCPLLVFEPPDDGRDDDETSQSHRFKTASGAGEKSTLHADEPLVSLIKKMKDNAFQRGVTVGRTGNNDIVLDDSSVSRFHAWFQRDEASGIWFMADAGSKNGTVLAGERLRPKKPTPIPEEAPVQFGEVSLTLYSPKRFLAFLGRSAR